MSGSRAKRVQGPIATRILALGAACLTLTVAMQTAASQATNHSTAQQPPNILLLVAEDLSPRAGFTGDAVAHTPTLDKLAARSVSYTRAFTTAGVCAPSRAALITGQHQISFGGQHMRTTTGPLGPYLARPHPQLKALPELLRRAGYYTFTDGKLDYQFSGIRANSGPFSMWNAEGPGAHWRNRRGKQPFFGLINFMQTHESGVMSVAGPALNRTHEQTRAFRTAAGLNAPELTDPEAVELPAYYPDLPDVRQDLARHYDNIRAMDAQVGTILQTLRDDGLAERTIIIWTTDHGDGLPRAKRELFDSGIHVPMLVHIPDALAHLRPAGFKAGTHNDRLVSFVDIAPALLRLAGVDASSTSVENLWHGSSFLHGRPRRYIAASRDRIDEVADRQRAIRDKRYKYIESHVPGVAGGHALAYRDLLGSVRAMRQAFVRGTLSPAQARWFESTPPRQLYDLRDDPQELSNLAGQRAYRRIERRMKKALREQLERVGDTSQQSEVAMRATLLDAQGKIPVTPPPAITRRSDAIVLTADNNASIAWRVAGGDWTLYTTPIRQDMIDGSDNESPTVTFEAKAVRYGFRPSRLTSLVVAPAAICRANDAKIANRHCD